MLAGMPQQSYTREEACRVAGVTERQLRGWERQELVPRLEEYSIADLIALRSLQKLLGGKVPPARIRRAIGALRKKLDGIENPLKELKIVCEGRRVAVLIDGQKMEPVSGQLLLDFDRAELKTLLSFPKEDREPPAAAAAKVKEAEKWFERGLELEETGALPEQIIDAYRRALELDPTSAGAAVNLGTIYYHLHRWEEAKRAYNQALEIDSTYALAHFNLGNLYDERGDRERAESHYQAALKINPNYADAHYNLALLSQNRGDAMKAVRHWKAYLKLDGASSWSAVARRELEKLCRAAVVPGARS
ncbi:MAG: tetratricopeptide repeat protein [Acidobacteriota bacterium]